MVFSDYQYFDDKNDSGDATNPYAVSNPPHHSNLLASFQEKNDVPVRINKKFDYVKVTQENYARKRQQLQDLRHNHAQKRASLATRFSLLNAPPSLSLLGGMGGNYQDDFFSRYNNSYKK